ncbi:MAG: glucose-1-phosphate adenylyltransferase subunit GlgD [Oscillospiraceae bacterium]|nr:glucose-1-phosphate adenylyltransferase subunit GlgD [Oscillospiraceae bacterium]
MNVMGIINLHQDNKNIMELTYNRPVAAIPFMGRYRIIDFPLSNLVNSGITNVGVFVQDNPRSLMDHVSSGKEWNLDRKADRIYMFYPEYTVGSEINRQELKNFRDNIDYIYYSKQDQVIIVPGNMICNIDYRDVIKFHKKHKSDITIIYKKTKNATSDFIGCDILDLDEEENLTYIGKNTGEKDELNISMEMYVMEKQRLLDLINASTSFSSFYTLRDIINHICSRIKVKTFEYTGYLTCINSVKTYYKKSLELLNLEIANQLFTDNNPIFTKTKDGPPTKYGEDAEVKNSFVASGSIIDGKVENSIIFRRTIVERNAEIKDSIVMQNSIVQLGARLECVCMDKNVTISKFKEIIGKKDYPVVIEKNRVV